MHRYGNNSPLRLDVACEFTLGDLTIVVSFCSWSFLGLPRNDNSFEYCQGLAVTTDQALG